MNVVWSSISSILGTGDDADAWLEQVGKYHPVPKLGHYVRQEIYMHPNEFVSACTVPLRICPRPRGFSGCAPTLASERRELAV